MWLARGILSELRLLPTVFDLSFVYIYCYLAIYQSSYTLYVQMTLHLDM